MKINIIAFIELLNYRGVITLNKGLDDVKKEWKEYIAECVEVKDDGK